MTEKTPDLIEEEYSYKKLLTETILESYPKYMQDNLLRSMEKSDVLSLRKRRKNNGKNLLDLSEVEETTDRISQAIESEEAAVKFIEKNEYFKPYKYSAIFYVDKVDDSLLGKLIEDGEVYDFFDSKFDNDNTTTNVGMVKPTMYSVGNTIMFKFSKTLTGYNPGSDERKQIKYPVIVIYSKIRGTLEVRLDSTRSIFRTGDLFYESQIAVVVSWFTKNLQTNIRIINFPPIIEHIKRTKSSEVVVDAQSMAFKNGGKAVLENGINQNYVLPLLGELKELMIMHEELFSKSPEIKVIIERFITEAETLSNLPWVTLLWKSDKTKVKFIFGADDDTFTILQYYGRKSDMEKMDYVTQYIIENRDELDRKEEAESEQDESVPSDIPAV
ncbi:hypothetical protein KDC22_14555 [Paenibacillus tritici]|uniref:hypothetical protein n=1 Tax=Paenibacillus tritici TaxID=1873425 RepID=UPI001BA5583F|nr:hypothetical protein [Paenibacillus tritici]QUL57588.1 hypothetical protein KDC22_14555 [Paenibacillus tritici]